MRSASRPLGPLAAFAALAVALATVVIWSGPVGAGAQGGGELVAQPALGAPASTFLGASPQEAEGEVWATAKNGQTLARYTTAGGWETISPPLASGGGPIAELQLAAGASAGRTTARGGVAVAAGSAEGPLLIVRDPGSGAHAAPDPGALLEPGEAMFEPESTPPLLAPFDAAGGRTGAYVMPEKQRFVLAFDGAGWSREEICIAGPGCTGPAPSFRVLGIEASGSQAWILGRNAVAGEGIELFQRQGSGPTAVWRQQSLGLPGSVGARFAEAAPLGVSVAARSVGQALTVSEGGVWVDAVLNDGSQSFEATVHFRVEGGGITSSASWCDLTSPPGLCQRPLAAELPDGQARSFAWPGGGPFGTRVVTGVGQGAILSLEGSAFTRIALAGGDAGAEQGAALSSPEEGWLGATPPLQLTHNPEGTALQPWPVPFRKPLLAIAAQPGASAGGLGSEAVAVGDRGQVARYVPGQGWEPESLLRPSGKRATPTLRGVAWPEPGRAYAVGDDAAMWLWQKATGLWEPDPGEPANLARANFTGIAFDPARPSRGYAIGKQGVLLGYKREWTPEPLPPGIPVEANFTSIAFAGSEALVTYKYPFAKAGNGLAVYSGGVIANDGSGWRVDSGAAEALNGAVPQQVAGLPDGGAVIASLGAGEAGSRTSRVIERQGPGAPWQPAAGGSLGYPAALAAIREGGQVRAIVSIAEGQGGEDLATDQEQVFNQPPPGQAPLLTDPYPLPGTGLVARQTATGWRDEEHEAFPLPSQVEGQIDYDLPRRPDPVLALLVSPDGSQGWAVGGETGTYVRFQGEAVQTAGVMRYGTAAAPPNNAAAAPIVANPGVASFAVGGNAQCAGPCADLAGSGIGPNRWLGSAVARAGAIPGVRGFIYTGPGVASGPSGGRLSASLSSLAFSREERAYARRLSAEATVPTFAAAAESDVDATGSLAAFVSAFSGFGAPLGSAPAGPGIAPLSFASGGQAYYSFNSGGAEGTVRMIVLDYSARELGSAQRCWLAGELATAAAAQTPAVVIGDRDLGGKAPNAAADASQVLPILTTGAPPAGCAIGLPPAGASAYLFDYPEQNREYQLSAGGRSIPAFGSGTLGYVTPPPRTESDFAGSSGFLIAAVNVAARNAATNVAPVGVRLIPNTGSLALDPTDGTLLRRSHQALFEGLARRPQAGLRCRGSSAPSACETVSPEPYARIPSECQGAKCSSTIFPEYTFTSSNPEVAQFVASDPTSINPRNVLLVNEKPVPDSHSGLLCAFNAGTTTVGVAAGGLSYSLKVTVLGGTAQRPCGTTPLKNPKRPAAPVPAEAPPAPANGPEFEPGPTPPPPAPPLAVVPAPAPVATPPPPPPIIVPAFFPPPAQLPTPVVPIVPPPPPPAVQTTPPSGTSSVKEEEEEDEEAIDMVSQMIARERGPVGSPTAPARQVVGASGAGGISLYVPAGLALIAMAAGIGLRRPPSRRRIRPRPAYESNIAPRRRR
jgi:hypothetical protein